MVFLFAGAKVVELADTSDLGSDAARPGGSSPPFRNIMSVRVLFYCTGRRHLKVEQEKPVVDEEPGMVFAAHCSFLFCFARCAANRQHDDAAPADRRAGQKPGRNSLPVRRQSTSTALTAAAWYFMSTIASASGCRAVPGSRPDDRGRQAETRRPGRYPGFQIEKNLAFGHLSGQWTVSSTLPMPGAGSGLRI